MEEVILECLLVPMLSKIKHLIMEGMLLLTITMLQSINKALRLKNIIFLEIFPNYMLIGKFHKLQTKSI